MNRVYLGFKIMKIRMKIAYEITLRKQTYQEIFLNAILRAYIYREEAGLIPNPFPRPKYQLMDELKRNNLVQTCHSLHAYSDDDHKHDRKSLHKHCDKE